MIYSYLSLKVGGANGNIQHFTDNGISYALLRSFAAMSIGVIVYELCLNCSKIKLTKAGKNAAAFIECSGYFIILLYSLKYGSTRMDFIFIIIFALCIYLSFSRKEKNIIFTNKLTDGLGKLTYSIYLIHIPVLRVFEKVISKDTGSLKILGIHCQSLNPKTSPHPLFF